MNKDTFLKQLAVRKNVWTGFFILSVLVTLVGGTYYFGGIAIPNYLHNNEFPKETSTLYGGALPYLIGFGVSMMLSALLLNLILRHIDTWLRNRYLKEYYIEDCGDVVKLHGSIHANGFALAQSNLLSSRPGYQIVDDAYAKYGCTMAAIKGN